MKANVIIGMYSGMIEEVHIIEDPSEATKKEAGLRKQFGLPENKPDREEDHSKNEVRHYHEIEVKERDQPPFEIFEDKHSDISASKNDGDDWYHAWNTEDGHVSVEHNPLNWPATSVIIDKTQINIKKKAKELAKEYGYRITRCSEEEE